MKTLLALIQPRTAAGAGRTDIRVATGGSAAAAGLGGYKWDAAIIARPRMSIELLSPTLDGKIQLGKADLALNLSRISKAQADQAQSLYWLGAPITIYDASGMELATAPIEFTGYVRSSSLDLDTNHLVLNLEVTAQPLEKPVLYLEFDGSGGAGGDPALRGTLKPAGFGAVPNVEPVMFDTARNIGMVDGYGNLTAVTGLFEGGNDFGPSVGNYATYADLAAAIDNKSVAPGRWATCLAQGMIGLGAPPAKPILVDCTFGSNRTGAIIQRLMTLHAGIANAEIDAAAFNSLDATVNRAVHYWTDRDRDVRDLCEALAAGCNATLLKTFQGLYSVARAFGGNTLAYLDRKTPAAGAPRVTKWRPLDPELPVWRMRARAARPGATLTIDQLNYTDDLIDRGLYSNTTVYRAGNLVWTTAGAQFLYVNATPAAGNALPAATVPPAAPASSTYWQQTKAPTTGADMFYSDGTAIEALKPRQAGADVTGTNQAATIAGQSQWATTTNTGSLLPGNVAGQVSALDTSGNLSSISKINDKRLTLVMRADNSTPLAEQSASSGIITSQNTASSIAGQAAWATYTGLAPANVAGQVQNLSTGGALNNLTNVTTRPITALYRNDNTTAITEAAVVTSLGTASAIAGQAAWATYTGLVPSTVAGQVTNLDSSGKFNSLTNVVARRLSYTLRDDDSTAVTEAAAITSLGTASAIAGQSPWATTSGAAGLTPTNVSGQVQFLSTAGKFNSLQNVVARRLSYTLRDDDATAVTEAAAITSLGTAASIAGQASWATYTGLAPANVAGQVQFLSTAGKFNSLTNIVQRRISNLLRDDDTTAVTEAATITALGTAAAFSGQTAWATYSGLVPANVAGQVQALDTSGNLSSLAKVSDRRITIMRRADGTTDVTEAAVVTSQGQAASIAGQGAFATDQRSPSQLFLPGANLLFNGGFRLADQSGRPFGWLDYYDPQIYRAPWINGAMMLIDGPRGPNDNRFLYSDPFSLPANINYTLQAETYTIPLTAGSWVVDVAYYSDAAGTSLAGQSAPITVTSQADWTARTINFTTPASGYASARVRVYTSNASVASGASIGVRKIKLMQALYSSAVPFTDEATDGANAARLANRIADPQIYNFQRIAGVSNTTNLNPSYTNNGSSITVSLPAHQVFIAGRNGPVQLNYGAGSFNVAYSSYWIAYIDDAAQSGNGSPSFGVTSNPNDLLYPNRRQVASGTTPSSSGTGGTTGTSSGGGGVSSTCVDALAWVEISSLRNLRRGFELVGGKPWIRARDVEPGDFVRILSEDGDTEWREVTRNAVQPSEAVEITTASGRTISCSVTTPITQPDLVSTVLASEALGHWAAVDRDEAVHWEQIVAVEPLGVINVAHISCNDGTYLAGDVAGEGVYTHNVLGKP